MKVTESNAAVKLTNLYNEGRRLNWLGVAGDSISRWLTPPEIMELEAALNLNGEYYPLQIKEPRLAKECFMFCCHGDVLPGDADGDTLISLMIFQVNAAGDKFRVLWESGRENHPPLELAMHLTAHAVHSVGPGCVVFHCQPMKTLALAAVIGQDEDRFLKALEQGFAAIRNMLPDGIGMIPWQMPHPQRRGMPMSEAENHDLRSFMAQIREHMQYQEGLVLMGEGVLCVSRSERSVHSIINAMERASTIRLEMMRAGVQ